MADTPSTGNTTPTIDQALPTDTAQSTGETVQLAQAAAVVQVSAKYLSLYVVFQCDTLQNRFLSTN